MGEDSFSTMGVKLVRYDQDGCLPLVLVHGEKHMKKIEP